MNANNCFSYVPSYIQRINRIQAYLKQQTKEFDQLEKEAWAHLRDLKRTKRQWNQPPFGDEIEQEEVLVDSNQRSFLHLPTPIIPQRPTQRPSQQPNCQCPYYNECPGNY